MLPQNQEQDPAPVSKDAPSATITKLPFLTITKNKTTQDFFLANKERGQNQNDTYPKLNIEESTLLDCIDFMGAEVAAGLLNTSYNVKLQKYWALALEQTKNDSKKATEIFVQSVLNDRASGESISKLKKEQQAALDRDDDVEALRIMKRIRQLERELAQEKAEQEQKAKLALANAALLSNGTPAKA